MNLPLPDKSRVDPCKVANSITVNMPHGDNQRVPAHVLRSRINEMFTHRGLSAKDATSVANTLVDTSLRGVDTHGVRLAPTYARLIDLGKANPCPTIDIKEVSPAVCHMKAGGALGPVAGIMASYRGLELAGKHGLGAVAVHGSNHFGSAGHYATLMAQRGAVGMVFSNADALVAPFSGRTPFFGTNPLAIAAPADGDDVYCLDMATSQTSYSRVMEHRRTGEPMPAGWSLDELGQPTEDAWASRALLPLGGYKGQGLAMAVEILTTLLTGADFDHVLAHALDGHPAERQSIGHLFLCIDIEPLCPLNLFRRRLSGLLTTLVEQPKRDGTAIFYAGQQEKICWRERTEHGIPVAPDVMRAFAQALQPAEQGPRS